jgi:hypothetical protein
MQRTRCVARCPYTYPGKQEITDKLEEVGYTSMLPVSFFDELIYFFVYKMKGTPVKYEKYLSPFEKSIRKFLRSVPTYLIMGNSPLEKAIACLVFYENKIDYGLLSSGTLSELDSSSTNYDLDPSSIVKYDVSDEELNDELFELLKTSLLVSNFLDSDVIPTDKTEFQTLKSYSEVTQANYSALARPDFKYKLATKNLRVQTSVEEPLTKKVIFIEDVSFSLEPYYYKIQAVHKALSVLDEEIQYYHAANVLKDMGTVSSDFFLNNEVARYKTDINIKKLVNELEIIHQDEDCIFIFLTDKGHYAKKISFKKTWNFIFINDLNKDLYNAALKSGGKSIEI